MEEIILRIKERLQNIETFFLKEKKKDKDTETPTTTPSKGKIVIEIPTISDEISTTKEFEVHASDFEAKVAKEDAEVNLQKDQALEIDKYNPNDETATELKVEKVNGQARENVAEQKKMELRQNKGKMMVTPLRLQGQQ